MNRLIANRAILAILAVEVERHPEMRFHQLLANVGIEEAGKDKFYEESEKTYEELSKRNLGV